MRKKELNPGNGEIRKMKNMELWGPEAKMGSGRKLKKLKIKELRKFRN